MEDRAKKLGIWGLEQRTKIAVVGNSLAVRLPKQLANFLRLSKGKEVSIYPIGKNKLVIEETGK